MTSGKAYSAPKGITLVLSTPPNVHAAIAIVTTTGLLYPRGLRAGHDTYGGDGLGTGKTIMEI